MQITSLLISSDHEIPLGISLFTFVFTQTVVIICQLLVWLNNDLRQQDDDMHIDVVEMLRSWILGWQKLVFEVVINAGKMF